ncbi:MAG: IctB family putative bicarbonate transporter [Jaaginema sp. PMC 1079.18]|nr:IctB family putative bicarbonate transporter [Jaaginema sp. PMC 1080.18]MEC4851059.1 IctB family putative bicarbonate transporter [Jaaginema sp. PMC 1079.18]MEC4866975.1 IctB family putative bicarbonate transporter [Jaaginema sp. PMC 1078.18]
MIQSAWQNLTLSRLPAYRWRTGSYLWRCVAFVSQWRDGSWLLTYGGEALAIALIGIVLIVGPFVSTALIGVLLLAMGAYWALITLTDRDSMGYGVTPIHYLVFLYWAIAALATAFSPVERAALSGLVILTLYLFLFLLSAQVLRSPSTRNWTIAIFLLVALLVSAYGIRQEIYGVEQLATWNDPESLLADDTRVYSYLGNPNLLASYLLPAIALSGAALFVWPKWLPKALAGTMLFCNLACLYYTDSRGGWLAALALLLTFGGLLYYWWRDRLPLFWQTWLLPLVLGGFAVLLLGAIAVVEPLRLRVMSIFAGREDSSNNFRINVWDAVFRMIGDRPVFGIGPGHDAFNAVYPLYMKTGYTALSAYSIYLEHIVEMGFLGFGAFLWLIVVTFNQGALALRALQMQNRVQGFWLIGAIAATVGLLAHGLFDTVWYRPQIHCLWWLMLGLIASFYPTIIRKQDSLS